MIARSLVLTAFAVTTAGLAAEPPARRPAAVPLKINTPLAHVTSAFELPDGKVLVSDVKTPAVLLIDPATGAVTPLGSVGAGPDQYVQPGGLYADKDGGALLLERAQLRVTAISRTGAFGRNWSIAIKGTTQSSSGDADLQRIDHRGFSYLAERAFGPMPSGTSRPVWPLVRFDPVKQQKDTIAQLQQGETMSITEGNMTRSQGVHGSPADGFGVAPDGRVAVVRGEPYRVEWIGITGVVTRGPDIAYDPVPMTDADRAAHKATMARGGGASVSSSGSGNTGSLSGIEPKYAATKAPFSPQDILVSPDARVWVMRSRAAASKVVTYDVFDTRGQRVDRLEFSDGSRVVGFGPTSVYVRETGADASVALKKYKVR